MTQCVLERLQAVRRELKQRELDALLVTSSDPHLCEYLPEHWKFLRHLSGFTGSFATLVVTAQRALLWTDSRYWEQAERELEGTTVELMRLGQEGVAPPDQWLQQNLCPNADLGCDTRTLSEHSCRRLEAALAERGLALTDCCDLMDAVWKERPQAPAGCARVFTEAQLTVPRKLADVRGALQAAGADALFLGTLEDIAWLTNLRGSDLACTPVLTAYLAVTDDSVVLYADPNKFTESRVCEHLAQSGITLVDYAHCREHVTQVLKERRVLVDPKALSRSACRLLEETAHAHLVMAGAPTTLLKSRKSRAELEALRETMREDGAALCEFFAWLEAEIRRGTRLTERDLAQRLHEERARRKGFVSDSFPAIVAFGANAALPHYNPMTGGNAVVEETADTLLLIDSGGQYETGTTDVTRTVLVGRASEAMKRDFTAVLRGHIALASSRFPKGVFGSQLDTLARVPLWEIGADFGHGTGHGVGFFLSVHEPPVSISPRAGTAETARVVPGLVLSNEPGLYRSGHYGIRTENLVTPVADETNEEEALPMLRMATLTLAPVDARLVKTAMMTPAEINWVNAYHARVRQELEPLLSEKARAWLNRACEVI